MKSKKSNTEPEWVQRNRDRSKSRYHKLVNENHFISRAEQLLQYLSELYGLDVALPEKSFFEVDFPFGVITGFAKKYSRCDYVVGKYCYTIFNNGTIKINLI